MTHQKWCIVQQQTHIISDLFGALSDNQCKGGYSHPNSYWNDEKLGKEAFAHFFGTSVLNNETKIDAIKSVFPNAFARYESLVDDI